MIYQFCISAASKGASAEEGKSIARDAGQALAAAGHTLITGATIGLPDEAAKAYKAAKGKMCLGVSPATSKIEHVMKYRLPTESFNAILYSGLHYVGRDVLLINSCDAVISIGGRIGTLHEFTIALETGTPIGIVQGSGGISTEIMDILHAAGRRAGDDVVFGETAEDVIKQLTAILDKSHKKYAHLYK